MLSFPQGIYVIGLTGNIGTGKSTVASLFENQGIPVIDTDEVAQMQAKTGSPVWNTIVEQFGKEVLTENGQLDRQRIADIVFKDKTARKKLEQITHPPIIDEVTLWIKFQKERGANVVVIEIPLLFEGGMESSFNETLVVSTSNKMSKKRLVKKKKWSEEHVEARQASQMPIDQKEEKADFVIANYSTLAHLKSETQNYLDGLEKRLS